jgi:nitric oxide reductase subunit C
VNVVQRKLLMGALLGAFAVQTSLVYLDDTASSFSNLSEEAVRGRVLWHEYNCQSCHQIHGFGGFLGPDLTNAAKRLTQDRLDEVLTVGTAQMPAFHFTEDERLDMDAFLFELSDMGIGVPRHHKPLDPLAVRSAVDQRLLDASLSDAVKQGAVVFRQNCAACHVPLQSTPLGLQTAPDLTTALNRLDVKGLREVVVEGRADRGMQSWKHLPAESIDNVVAFVKWLNDDRSSLAKAVGGVGAEQALPWWEYK